MLQYDVAAVTYRLMSIGSDRRARSPTPRPPWKDGQVVDDQEDLARIKASSLPVKKPASTATKVLRIDCRRGPMILALHMALPAT